MLTDLSSHPWIVLGIVFGLLIVLIRIVSATVAVCGDRHNPPRAAPSPSAARAAPARYDYQAESDAWFRRSQQLWHLQMDLRNAEQLMELEEQAHVLRRRYAERRAPYSSQVEDDLTAILTRIDTLKHNPHSG